MVRSAGCSALAANVRLLIAGVDVQFQYIHSANVTTEQRTFMFDLLKANMKTQCESVFCWFARSFCLQIRINEGMELERQGQNARAEGVLAAAATCSGLLTTNRMKTLASFW